MSRMQNAAGPWRLANSRTWNVTLSLGLIGLALILVANTFSVCILKVQIDNALANLGALLLITGILQQLYDTYVKKELFSAIRSQVINDSSVTESGISGYFEDSKNVDLTSDFVNSNNVVIGINYSSSLIRNLLDLIQQRVIAKKQLMIVHIAHPSMASKYLESDYESAHIDLEISKIKQIIDDCDPDREYISIRTIDTIMRYSFISFDSRIWIVVATNGAGRRKVPGFFVASPSSWYDHFRDDICRLLRSVEGP